jgi:murein L,D-transpeptidase YcbB/YkuD
MTGEGKPVAAGVVVLLLVALTACGEDRSAAAGVSGEDPPAVAAGEGVQRADDAASQARSMAAQEQSREQARAEALRARLAAELPAALDALVVERAWRELLRLGLGDRSPVNLPAYRRELLEPLYREREFRPIFAGLAGGTTGRAEVLLNELRATHQHALDATPYRLEDLNRLEPLVAASEPLSWEWSLDADALATLGARAQALAEPSASDLARLAAGLEGDAPLPALAESFGARERAAREALRDEADFELVAAHAFMSYAFDMRHFNTSAMTYEQLTAAGGQRTVQRERLRQSFRDAAEATPEALEAQLEALYPPHEQYPRLMTARARYQEIVDAGGWPEVPARSLSRGSSNPRVAQLKQRLAIEGFYSGPFDNSYDQALEDAVRSYQETHQMQVTGEPHNMFWQSLNIPADRRLAQIELTMQRWRETRMQGEDYFVFVNIPDFHAEVWRNGERQLRFRIVVGNTETRCNARTGRREYVNATPVQAASMEYLVFNPYWNVPERIRREELDLELLSNPQWLQQNGYEVVITPSGPRIRQLPGEGNALGAVKFIFPNIHNTYMHDTPRRRYFDLPIRNFSHGCMRVQNPMDFAELLLTNDENWDPERIERVLDSGVETTVRLRTHVPIFIEYYVVRVDELGRTHFLSDVYRYDRMRMEGTEMEACRTSDTSPVASNERAVVWNTDGTAVMPDGTVIHPDGRVDRSSVRSETPRRRDADDGDTETVRRLQRGSGDGDGDGDGGRPERGDYGP